MRKPTTLILSALILCGVATATRAVEISLVDYAWPSPPAVGATTLHILSPTMLELKLVNTKPADPARVNQWDFVNGDQFNPPSKEAIKVTVNGNPIAIKAIGFKRRPLYGPVAQRDLRIDNSLFLELASPVAAKQVVEVTNPDNQVWPKGQQFKATVEPQRFSPAIHVNQEGYMPNYSKKAMVGYYLGNLGEMAIPASAGFCLVDAETGQRVFKGTLTQRKDVGWNYSPAPYQQVFEADFSSFKTPGEYRLLVPGLGASLSFLIHDGIAMSFARTYALGLYHQRCGTSTCLPHTRFTHGPCHTAPAKVPDNAGQFPFTWTTVAEYGNSPNPNNPPQSAPALVSPETQLFPYVKKGQVNVSGGHHDAGDYSKYTANCASLVHYLMFAVDSLTGVESLDNLGIPESGDGISDVLQEAKWEADYLAKIQDDDGGFYFLVYPQDRRYENNVPPDKSDPQVVWPKNTAVTAAAVAALAQTGSSPAFKKAYPDAAARYVQKARKGWDFLMKALSRYGQNGAFQKITHYGDNFTDQDELAWAACEIFLATGDQAAHQFLLTNFNPADPATYRWGWWRMSECYGHAIRSYGFAVRSGRKAAAKLDPAFLKKCRAEIIAAGDDMLKASQQSAYGSSFPEATKRVRGAGWYFSTDQAYDLAVAYQLSPKKAYINAMLENMNYEGGCNPVNVCYLSGLGWKRTRNVVSQWAANVNRKMPPTGIPVGNISERFLTLWGYDTDFSALSFPAEGAETAPYPFYDRWGDLWNVTAEFVVLNQARSLGTLGFLAAMTPKYRNQDWKAPRANIVAPNAVTVGKPVTLQLQVAGMDLSEARIVWEGCENGPVYGQSFKFTPKKSGSQWVEVEAQWPDGRRVSAKRSFNAN